MGNPGTTSALYAARPTIQIEGQEEAALSEGLISMFVEETTAGLYRCELRLGNWGSVGGRPDYLYFDRRLFDFGKPVSIAAGDGEGAGILFEGRIMGLEAHYRQMQPPEITILAEDRLQDLRMTRRTRTFEVETDQGVMEAIAQQHGLQAEIDFEGPAHAVLAQLNQSDLAFLRERARAVDAQLWLEDESLHVVSRQRRDHGEVQLTFGQGLREFSVLADVANQRSSVTVAGWNVAAKEQIAHRAGATAIQSELNGSESGASVLEGSLGERAETIVHHAPFDEQQARYLAESHFRRLARQFVTGRGLAEGDARIRVGGHVLLDNLGPLFDGRYYITSVRHLFDAQRGYRSEFEVERPGIGSG